MNSPWEVSSRFCVLDLDIYLAGIKPFKSVSFVLSRERFCVIKSGKLLLPLFIGREGALPHPHVSPVIVRFFVSVDKISNAMILRITAQMA